MGGLKVLTEHDRLEAGVVYAVRPWDGSMYYEPAVHLGWTWKQIRTAAGSGGRPGRSPTGTAPAA